MSKCDVKYLDDGRAAGVKQRSGMGTRGEQRRASGKAEPNIKAAQRNGIAGRRRRSGESAAAQACTCSTRAPRARGQVPCPLCVALALLAGDTRRWRPVCQKKRATWPASAQLSSGVLARSPVPVCAVSSSPAFQIVARGRRRQMDPPTPLGLLSLVECFRAGRHFAHPSNPSGPEQKGAFGPPDGHSAGNTITATRTNKSPDSSQAGRGSGDSSEMQTEKSLW